MADWLGTVVAERELTNAQRPGRPASLRIGMPRRRRTGEFECRYEIRGFGRARRRSACGEDAVQALELVFVSARAELVGMQEVARWHEMPAYLTLPIAAGSWLPPRFAARIEKAVERVMASFWEDARKRGTLRE